MAATRYTALLRGGGPWGFRIQGGKDFGSPLSISKVRTSKCLVVIFAELFDVYFRCTVSP